MISNLTACGKWDGCAVASQLPRRSSVASWAGIQVEGDALAYAICRDIGTMKSLGTMEPVGYEVMLMLSRQKMTGSRQLTTNSVTI